MDGYAFRRHSIKFGLQTGVRGRRDKTDTAAPAIGRIERQRLRQALVRAELLAPIFLIISFAGVYAQDQQFSDIVIAIVFGLIGCVAKDLDFPVVPLVLGLVLGRLLETSFTQSLEISGGDWTIFFTRPLSGFLLLTAAGLMGLTLYQSLRAKKKRLIVEENSAVGSA